MLKPSPNHRTLRLSNDDEHDVLEIVVIYPVIVVHFRDNSSAMLLKLRWGVLPSTICRVTKGMICQNAFFLLGAYPRQDVAAQMPVLRHSACCCRECHRTNRIRVVFLPFLSWLSSASFPGYHSLHYRLLQTIEVSNVAKVFKFLTSYKIIQPVRW